MLYVVFYAYLHFMYRSKLKNCSSSVKFSYAIYFMLSSIIISYILDTLSSIIIAENDSQQSAQMKPLTLFNILEIMESSYLGIVETLSERMTTSSDCKSLCCKF